MTELFVDPITAAPGVTVRLTGQGFPPDTTVTLRDGLGWTAHTSTGDYGRFIDNHAVEYVVPSNLGVTRSLWLFAEAGAYRAEAMLSLVQLPTPPPVPPPVSRGGTILFQDTFDGSPGLSPDPSKWLVLNGTTLNGRPTKRENVFLNGRGQLVIRAKREASGYSSGALGTFSYGSGWPPTAVKASFMPPFRVDVTALMPSTPGAWCGPWLMTTDRDLSQDNFELDIAEARMTMPTVAGSHQHCWVERGDVHPWDGHLNGVADMGKNWHTYACRVYLDHVDYLIDDQLIGTSYGVNGEFGALADNGIALPNSWGAAGGQPAASDIGPWDMLFDSFTVTRL